MKTPTTCPRRLLRPLTLLAFLPLLALALHAGADAGTDAEASKQTLEGEFVWTDYERGPLKATFEPTGEDQWDVIFHFRWNGDRKVWRGTAEGDLTEGPLRGTVKNEDRRRTWNFEGTTTDGVFRGTHEEIKRTGSKETGTLTLRIL